MSNGIFDITGYAVRVGVNGTVNAEPKKFAITNSTLKSACAESDDAVIVIRTSATKAKLTLTSTAFSEEQFRVATKLHSLHTLAPILHSHK